MESGREEEGRERERERERERGGLGLQRIVVGDWERSGSGVGGVKECEGAARKERARREMREMAVVTAISLFFRMFLCTCFQNTPGLLSKVQVRK
jgi:hypothetical protein